METRSKKNKENNEGKEEVDEQTSSGGSEIVNSELEETGEAEGTPEDMEQVAVVEDSEEVGGVTEKSTTAIDEGAKKMEEPTMGQLMAFLMEKFGKSELNIDGMKQELKTEINGMKNNMQEMNDKLKKNEHNIMQEMEKKFTENKKEIKDIKQEIQGIKQEWTDKIKSNSVEILGAVKKDMEEKATHLNEKIEEIRVGMNTSILEINREVQGVKKEISSSIQDVELKIGSKLEIMENRNQEENQKIKLEIFQEAQRLENGDQETFTKAQDYTNNSLQTVNDKFITIRQEMENLDTRLNNLNNIKTTSLTESPNIIMNLENNNPKYYNDKSMHPKIFVKRLESHLEQLKKYLGNKYDQGLEIKHIRESLKGEARAWFEVKNKEIKNFDNFREAFLKHYWGINKQCSLKAELNTGKYDSSTGVTRENYLIEKFQLFQQIEPMIDECLIVRYLSQHFHAEVYNKVIIDNIDNFDKFVELIRNYDLTDRSKNRYQNQYQSKLNVPYGAGERSRQDGEMRGRFGQGDGNTNNMQRNPNRYNYNNQPNYHFRNNNHYRDNHGSANINCYNREGNYTNTRSSEDPVQDQRRHVDFTRTYYRGMSNNRRMPEPRGDHQAANEDPSVIVNSCYAHPKEFICYPDDNVQESVSWINKLRCNGTSTVS